MKVIYANIRSANCNLLNLTAQFHDKNIDVYALTETWFTKDFNTYMPNFTFTGIGNRLGGGVGFYIRKHLNFSVINDACIFDGDIECYGIKLVESGDTLVIIYRPHSSIFDHFISLCETTLNTLSSTRNNITILGDFNFDFNKPSPCSLSIIDLFNSYGLKRMIFDPTRVTKYSSTCIDNIFSNTQGLANVKLNVDISDHFPISLEYGKPTKIKSIKITDMGMKNMNYFVDRISAINWNSLYIETDSNAAYNCFENKITKIYHKSFPLKEIIISSESWITETIKRAIKNKRKLFKIYKKTPTETNHRNYTTVRNNLNNQIRNARSKYIYNKINNTNNSKTKWKIINEATGRVTKKKNLPESINPNDINQFFTTVIKADSPLTTPITSKANTYTCALFDTTEIEVERVIGELSHNSAPGSDGLHPKPIKFALHQLSKPLTFLINLSFMSGIYPERLKHALITPVHKKGDTLNFSNYRPISVLSTIAKIFDKIYLERITAFCNKHNILSKYQFGFRKKCNTELAIASIYKLLLNALDKSSYGMCVFLDLEKAFDSVPHTRLLQKLEHIGIRGLALRWITNYLLNRTCSTKINNNISEPSPIYIGVPQGSILSPMLFNLYINDLIETLPPEILYLYADDTALILENTNLVNLINIGNNYLNLVNTWLENNGLKLNISKTEFIIFANPGKSIDESICTLNISGREVKRVFAYKYLGVWFDHQLKWNEHINYICNKLSKASYIIRQSNMLFPRNILFELYYSLFYSHLTYGTIAWGNTTKHNINRLLIIQKRLIRSIYKANWLSPTAPLFQRSKLLDINQICTYSNSIFIHKYHTSPYNLFTTKSVDSIKTRGNNLLEVQICRTTKKLNSIFYTGIKEYNYLYPLISEIKTMSNVKIIIKNYIKERE